MENVEIKEVKPVKKAKMISAEDKRKSERSEKAKEPVVKAKDVAKQKALIAFMKGCNERRANAKLAEAYSEEEIKAEEAKL